MPLRRTRWLPLLWTALILALASAGLGVRAAPDAAAPAGGFRNAYPSPGDTGERAGFGYFLHRAWVQITRDLAATEVPPTVPLDLPALAARPFAVAWLGHAAMLMRVGRLWVLIDPALTDTAGPVPGIGPARLTPLPLALDALPRIDLVLVSHDHYDHLDRATVRHLARQAGGPPRFFVGQGLGAWFRDEVGAPAQEFGWWQAAQVGEARFTFVPAQHNSARLPWARNTTLWGGWVVEQAQRRFYFAGDTAHAAALFDDIRQRIGAIDLAALPIGAYQPRPLMRFEHLDPDDAVQAHQALGAVRSFGVHWGTFQLGDEEPFQPARDLADAVARRGSTSFGLMPIGAVLDVAAAAGPSPLLAPAQLRAARARP